MTFSEYIALQMERSTSKARYHTQFKYCQFPKHEEGEKRWSTEKIRHLSFSQFAPIFSQRGHLALEAHSLTSSVGRDNSDFSRFSDFGLVLRG